MITALLLAMLGTALVAVLIAMVRAPSGARMPVPPAPAPARPVTPAPAPAAPLELDPWDARKGDVVSISGAAEDYTDLDFPVERRSAYEAASHRWVALAGTFRGRPVELEIYRFPKAQYVGYLDVRELTIADLGLTEDRLAEMDSRQDPSAFIDFDGKRWLYESSREIGYYANETGQAEGSYRWIFNEQSGDRLVVVEKWEGEPFAVRIARQLEKRNFTVYRA